MINLGNRIKNMHLRDYLDFHPDVMEAIEYRHPVVALESTIISHGMPFPQNIETALLLENEVRKNGAVPATIAIINGVMKAGLLEAELEKIGNPTSKVIKCSRRDLPVVIHRKLNGATTVAATMLIADLAGIPIFATGGIGGVHRGASISMDISADLQELAETNVAVVSAGAKAILDIGLTLEYLETLGVPVLGFRTKEFPAFYSRSSGHMLDYSYETPKEVAEFLKIKNELGMKGGTLIANPIQKKAELDYLFINNAITKAIEEANNQNITGKEVTPFLLDRIFTLTEGKSLESNIDLVMSNAQLAAKIAVELEKF
jgi:pseudouridine-5'-phosphate glycosidase